MNPEKEHPTGKIVVVFGGVTKETLYTGECSGYYTGPTICIDDGSDHGIVWAANLCRMATSEEATEYWKDRAMKAEEKLNAM